MNAAKLKDQARRHEQAQEWQKALDLYLKVIQQTAEEEEDLGVYNRVGDLYTRLGNTQKAIEYYEGAVDRYVEAGLHNSAIALCKKILRSVPGRTSLYLRLGQICADQGFVTDARQNFLEYAERKQQEGDLDEAFRALEECADLVPSDLDIRVRLASQLEAHGRKEEAARQLVPVYQARRLSGDEKGARALRERIQALDPSVDLARPAVAARAGETAAAGLPGFEPTALAGVETGGEVEVELGEIQIGGLEPAAAEEAEKGAPVEGAFAVGGDLGLSDFTLAVEGAEEEVQAGAAAAPEGFSEFEMEAAREGAAEPVAPLSLDESEQLATLELSAQDQVEAEAEQATELPLLEVGGEEEGEAAPLPTLELGEEEGVEALPLLDLGGEAEEAEPFPLLEAEEAAPVARGARGVEAGALAAPIAEKPRDLVEILRARLAADSEDYDAWVKLGEELLERGAREDGVDALERAHRGFADANQVDSALRVMRELVRMEPDNVRLHQKLVEYAFRKNERSDLIPAYLGLAACLERLGQDPKAKAVYQRILDIDPGHGDARAAISRIEGVPVRPEAAKEEYVDLGSLVLDEGTKRTTRFVVAEEEPTGDEDADFGRMLAQFKSKVSDHVGAEDYSSHYDLGVAFKEMGLLDEAIAEFQQALRGPSQALRTYEMLGQCFLETGQPSVALKTLTRALSVPYTVEDEMVGVYYYLGRAYEALGQGDAAREYYEKVFGLDINFQDVSERLRALK